MILDDTIFCPDTIPDWVGPRKWSDDGAAIGLRTRYFRNGRHGGVEWIYAVDFAAGYDRWYGFGMGPDKTIADLIASGMKLRFQHG